MVCPNCNQPKTSVTNSRPRSKDASIWRRRHCSACGFNFTTEETPVLDSHRYVHNSKLAQQQVFSIGKLTLSIAKAFVHDLQKGSLSAYDLARTVEQQLVGIEHQINTSTIYSLTEQTLARFDKMAATVYAAQHGVKLA